MNQQYDVSAGLAPGTTVEQARTRAFLGLSLALVGLLGGGILANAVFHLVLDPATYGSGIGATVIQALPPLVMGAVGGGLGWSAATSTDDLAVPVGRAATVMGGLAVLGAIALAIAGQV